MGAKYNARVSSSDGESDPNKMVDVSRITLAVRHTADYRRCRSGIVAMRNDDGCEPSLFKWWQQQQQQNRLKAHVEFEMNFARLSEHWLRRTCKRCPVGGCPCAPSQAARRYEPRRKNISRYSTVRPAPSRARDDTPDVCRSVLSDRTTSLRESTTSSSDKEEEE